MIYRTFAIACFLLLPLQANAATWNIDGVFATETRDNWSCLGGFDSCPGQHSVFSISALLLGTVDIPDGGGIADFNLALANGDFTGGASILGDAQSWTFSYHQGTLTALQFTVTDGLLSDGLFYTGTDFDYFDTWQVKFTNLTGTAVDPPTVTPLPPALPLFAAGLLALLTLRRTQWHVGN